MEDRRIQFRVGAVVLATVVIGGLLVALNGPGLNSWIPWAQGKYEIAIDLQQAPGIAPNTPVRKNGILIGRVASVKDMGNRVVVMARIDDQHKLYPNYACQVRTSVLGDSTIDFSSHSIPPGAQPLKDGDSIKGTVLGNPLDMIANLQGDMSVMTTSLSKAGDEVATLAENLNNALGQGEGQQRFVELLDRTIAALDNFSKTMQSAEEVLGDQQLKDSIKTGLAELPQAVRDIRVTMVEAQNTLKTFDGVMMSAQRNLQNIEGLTEPLGQNGQNIVNSVIAAVDSVDRLLEEVSLFTNRISNSQGTLGRLMNDPTLYDQVKQLTINSNNLVWRINCLTAELSPKIQKTVQDASVFMDKIARNPGRLVGGALDRGPNLK